MKYPFGMVLRPLESWRPAHGFPNYEVSDHGRVRRAGSPARGVRVGRVLTPQPHKQGYRTVQLYRNGIPSRRTIHTLVWDAFVGTRPAGSEVNHRNGIKSDNGLWNLELTDSAGNKKHASENGLSAFGFRNAATKLSAEHIRAVVAAVQGGESQRSVASRFGISQGHVSDIVNRRRRRSVDLRTTGTL